MAIWTGPYGRAGPLTQHTLVESCTAPKGEEKIDLRRINMMRSVSSWIFRTLIWIVVASLLVACKSGKLRPTETPAAETPAPDRKPDQAHQRNRTTGKPLSHGRQP